MPPKTALDILNETYIASYEEGVKDLEDYTPEQKEAFVKALKDHDNLQELGTAFLVYFQGNNKDKIAQLYQSATTSVKTTIVIISFLLTIHSAIIFYFLRNFTVFYYFIMYLIITVIVIYLCLRLSIYLYARMFKTMNKDAEKRAP